MPSFSESIDLIKQTGKSVVRDDCPSMSAAIAYYTLLSLPALLVIVVAASGLVFGSDVVQERLTGQAGGLIGEGGAEEIRTMIENAGDVGGGSLFGTVLGLLALVFGATGAFARLQQSLNKAWDVRPDPERSGIKNFVTKRVLSFGMVLVIAFLLVVSLAASTALSVLTDEVQGALGPAGSAFAWLGNIALSLGLFTLLFAAIFKVLPDAEIEWRDVWVGGFVTALLLVIGQFAIGYYFGRSSPGELYGAAGSVVVILVWIYFAALILLVGAEFTQVWARRHGSRITPEDDAVRVAEERRILQEGTDGEAEAPASEAPASEEAEREQRGASHPYAEPREPAPRSGWSE